MGMFLVHENTAGGVTGLRLDGICMGEADVIGAELVRGLIRILNRMKQSLLKAVNPSIRNFYGKSFYDHVPLKQIRTDQNEIPEPYRRRVEVQVDPENH
jgi:hypothetical protein